MSGKNNYAFLFLILSPFPNPVKQSRINAVTNVPEMITKRRRREETGRTGRLFSHLPHYLRPGCAYVNRTPVTTPYLVF